MTKKAVLVTIPANTEYLPDAAVTNRNVKVGPGFDFPRKPKVHLLILLAQRGVDHAIQSNPG
ncbi:MAG: hypothetical protein ACLQU3_13175 [Limisphaerales bacterium]